jgi:hypothetical protein
VKTGLSGLREHARRRADFGIVNSKKSVTEESVKEKSVKEKG